ncbi:MAG: hypothetical protein IT366_15690 [Candidatus Hydrogenedentes bacterium]|nr:hypothetical protein [Candidatus Hydrogenedentota bacterium]
MNSGTPHARYKDVIAVLIVFSSPLFIACIWYHGTAPDGSAKRYEPIFLNSLLVTTHSDEISDMYGEIIASDNRTWEKKAKELQSLSNPRSRNDYAASLIYLGRYEEAIQILLALDKDSEDKSYAVASNLGTAYELSGNNGEALKWIEEGISRDAESHFGTEWLHKAILKAKIEKRDAVFGLTDPFDFGVPKPLAIDGVSYEPKEVLRAIVYQTAERAAFVKPKDPLIADLFATAGNIAANEMALEPAIAFFELASIYGHPRAKEIENWIPKTRKDIEEAARMRAIKRNLMWGAGIASVVLVIAAWIYFKRAGRSSAGA